MIKDLILIIDDENAIRRLLEISLQSNGYKTVSACNGKEGLLLAASHQPDLILLDIGLPDINGQVLLKRLREWYVKPIVMLSAQSDEENIVQALDNGANDYLCKPFRTGELLARIRSSLRNLSDNNHQQKIEFDSLRIDLSARLVYKHNNIVKLTSTEYSLLTLLVKNEGRVLTHQYILNAIWGPSYALQTQYLRVFIAQLRKKIEKDSNHPKFILTESGVGYRFMIQSESL